MTQPLRYAVQSGKNRLLEILIIHRLAQADGAGLHKSANHDWRSRWSHFMAQ